MTLVYAKKSTLPGKKSTKSTPAHQKKIKPWKKSTVVLLKALATIPDNLNVNKGVCHSLFMKKREMTLDPQMH